MFDNLTKRFDHIFSRLRGKGRLSDADIDSSLEDVRVALLEADVAVEVVNDFLENVRVRAQNEDINEALSPGQQVIKIVQDELTQTLGTSNVPLDQSQPTVILMVGLQGSGKTTTAAKLARLRKKQNRRPLLVAADLARPAATEQLQKLGDDIGVSVFTVANSRQKKPARLVKAALAEAKTNNYQDVIIDSAGRLQIDRNLMNELGAIAHEAKPQETLLVIDAMTGQTAIDVARGFSTEVDLSGLILSKLDGDARGGAAISARAVTGVPIKFFGTGEKTSDLEPFHPDRLASRILGMGDVLSLIEKTQEQFDAKEAEQVAERMLRGEGTFEQFLDLQEQVAKMGPIKQLAAMLPGAGGQRLSEEVNDRQTKMARAIIQSMTLEERRNQIQITGSRRRRIAAGSGTKPADVNRLLKSFRDASQWVQRMSRGGVDALKGLDTGMTEKSIEQMFKGRM